MKKPLLITYEYPPDYGGVGKYLEQEVRAFDGEVKVVRAQNHWINLMWSVHPYFTKPKPSPSATSADRQPSGEGVSSCDSMWISHILPIGYIALVYKKIFKIPYRVYLHGLDLVRPRKSKWKSFWICRILNNADEIICNSNATAQLLQYYDTKFNGSTPLSRLKIQHPRIHLPSFTKGGNACPPERREGGSRECYQSIGRSLRQKYGIDDKPILLTISRLVRRKGIDLVVRALPEVWKQIPDLVYVVVGDGEERGHLEQLKKTVMLEGAKRPIASACNTEDSIALNTGLQNDSVIFTGSISDEEKYGWLSACDCFILTPINDPNDFEGYGIVYKEAQMFQKPVIGSRVGGVPEAVG